MYKIVKHSEGIITHVTDNNITNNLVTKEFSPTVSLTVIEAMDNHESITADYNSIYFVFEGLLMLNFGDAMFALQPGDTCYVTKGEKYAMIGTFKSVLVSQPAIGTPIFEEQ